jgi:lysine N6-hydroxylase
MTDVPRYHTAGIGAGPANLSLAALFGAVKPERIALFEAQPAPSWHNTLLFPGVRMQTAWIKDLVSLVDPCHRLSFLSYLVTTRRVFPFLSAQYTEIPRLEYARYLQWAASQIPGIRYGTPIDEVGFDSSFALYSEGEMVARSEHLVIGIGSRPRIPQGLDALDRTRLAIAEDLVTRLDEQDLDRTQTVAVIGCGQTGAECVLELRRRGFTDIRWFGSRSWFAPLDDSPTANETFRPAYSAFLERQPLDRKRELAREHVLTSDGIALTTLRAVFQDNYEEMLRTGSAPVTMYPGRRVVAGERQGEGVRLRCKRGHGQDQHDVRLVVVAAGRRPAPLPFDERLREMVDTDEGGNPVADEDYSLRWKGEDNHKIFVQNRSRYAHGLQDANLSLLAVRSAVIINSLFGRRVYNVSDDSASTVWD